MRLHSTPPPLRLLAPLECTHCGDLGVIQALSLYDQADTLMLCDCAEGKNQTYRLPRWEWNSGKIFKRAKCPVEWFKPEASEMGQGGFKLNHAVQRKIDAWKAKIQIAEWYWQQSGKEQS